jgi:transposase-like protein
MIADYRDNRMSVGQIAIKYGVCASTVRNALVLLEPQELQRQARISRGSTFEILRELLTTFDSFAEIGRRHKVSKQAVHQVWMRANKAQIPGLRSLPTEEKEEDGPDIRTEQETNLREVLRDGPGEEAASEQARPPVV